jgi:hypothetical protein
LPSDPSSPIADLRTLLSQRVGLELSPIELAEILWLALQRGDIVVDELESRRLPKPAAPKAEQALEQRSSSSPGTKQPASDSFAVVAEPPPPGEEPEPDSDQSAGLALPVNIPEAVALRNRRAIARSLRPLMRKVASKQRQVIDEEATVMQIAETQTWSPVVQPEPERWLELAIVIEVTNVLDVWWDTIAEFQQLMERHGAFRTVRTWQLKPNTAGESQLFLQTAAGLRGGARSPRELLDAAGRRLILLLSDCTSRAWRSGKIPKLLELWSRENPVTLVQLLPPPYWDRSALKTSYSVALRSRRPGALSRDWAIDGLSPRQRQQLPGGLKLPVVTMQPESFRQWARAIAAIDEQRTTGIVLTPPPQSHQDFPPPVATAQAPPLTANQLVQRFRNTASAKAQELADMMAVLPVNWSVIRLIQKNLLPDPAASWQPTGALSLAEILLSGLLRPEPLPTESAQHHRIKPQYDFVEGVRDVLLGTIPISEAQAVGEKVAKAVFQELPSEVQDRVNADIERRFGDSLSYFEAFLIPDLPWEDAAATEIFPFAQVTGQVLRRWGGAYAALAEELARSPGVSVSIEPPPLTNPLSQPEFSIPVPPLREFEFEVATIAVEPDLADRPPGIVLEPFEYTLATLTLPHREIRRELAVPLNAFQRVDEAVYTATGEHLSSEERVIFIHAWEGLTYAGMGINMGYSQGYVSKQAAELWHLLSQTLGRKVTKTNLQDAVWQWAITSRQQQQGQQLTEALGAGVSLAMVAIPAGRFLMGAAPGEDGASQADPNIPCRYRPFCWVNIRLPRPSGAPSRPCRQSIARSMSIPPGSKVMTVPWSGFLGKRPWSFAIASPATRAKPTACPAKQNGNTPAERAPQPPFILVQPLPPISLTIMAMSPMAMRLRGLTESKPRPLAVLRLPMPLGYPTCMAMYGNGAPIAGIAIMKVHRAMAVHG